MIIASFSPFPDGSDFKRALEYPIRQIAINTGESPDVVVDTVLRNGKDSNFGFDAKNLIYVDNLYESGIIDPLRVVKTSFLNALSIAIEILKGGGYSILMGESGKKNMSSNFEDMIPGGVGDNPSDFLDGE